MISVNRLCVASSLVIAALLCGCSGSKIPSKVHGKVIYHNEPVPGGMVTFHVPDGGILTYPLTSQGEFTGANMPAGEMVVTVETEGLNPERRKMANYGGGKGPAMDAYRKKMMERGGPPEAKSDTGEKYVKIPEKYTDPKQSPLKVNLEKGNNELTLEIKDD
jgi:hypothetical protein